MPDSTTRADTLVLCMKRLQWHGSKIQTERLFGSLLLIHFPGADYSEGRSPIETWEIFKPFLDFIAQEYPDLKTCTLNFIGPNISRQLHQQVSTFSVQRQKQCLSEQEVKTTTQSGCIGQDHMSLPDMSVHLHYFAGSYENYMKGEAFVGKESMNVPETSPHLIVSYNAGIWGYDDWIPAIETILQNAQCPWLITSYNENEADDDKDVLIKIFPALHWYWKPEKNLMGANTPRQTRNSSGSTVWENDYWMCVGATKHRSTGATRSEIISCKN
uniref:Uncharacterized protein AlNc14C99G5968 n=1 Tax=Albugo laibachii Nc14 TaxID=890382 RepID=F0WHA2_9STRA|nr:conserved hypothetical protein [Albugo laibachii Nc14]|eukprot:CCA20618.1 conserved hypothetical protein [Albugo laibachii Nc14]